MVLACNVVGATVLRSSCKTAVSVFTLSRNMQVYKMVCSAARRRPHAPPLIRQLAMLDAVMATCPTTHGLAL